jgi:hypothetical protein
MISAHMTRRMMRWLIDHSAATLTELWLVAKALDEAGWADLNEGDEHDVIAACSSDGRFLLRAQVALEPEDGRIVAHFECQITIGRQSESTCTTSPTIALKLVEVDHD